MLVGGFHSEGVGGEGVTRGQAVARMILCRRALHLARAGDPGEFLLPNLQVVRVVLDEERVLPTVLDEQLAIGEAEGMLGEDVVRGREVRIYVVRTAIAGAVHEVVQVQRVMEVEMVIQPEADERQGAAIVSVHAVAAQDLAAGGLDVGAVPAVFAEGGVDRLGVIPGVGGRE